MFTIKSIIGIIAFFFITVYVLYAVFRIRKVAIQKELAIKARHTEKRSTEEHDFVHATNLEKVYVRAIEMPVKSEKRIKKRTYKGSIHFHQEFEFDLN